MPRVVDHHEPRELLRGLRRRERFGRRMICDDGLAVPLAESLWYDLVDQLDRGTILQVKERCRVVRLDRLQVPLVLKQHRWSGLLKSLNKSRLMPKAERAFWQGRFLLRNGVPTPRPLALVNDNLGPLTRSSSLLTEFVAGESLYRFLRRPHIEAAKLASVVEQVAAICGSLAGLRCAHNDLKPENLIVDGDGQVWLIDLENTRRYTIDRELAAALCKDFKRLLHPRAWRDQPAAAEMLRERLVATPELAELVSTSQESPLAKSWVAGADDARLSVLLLARRDSVALTEAWHSVRDVADEVLVVDVGLDNRAREVVRQLEGARLIDSPGPPLESCRRALAEAASPWILVLQPNEELSPDLALEVQGHLTAGSPATCFCVRRRPVFLGRVQKYGMHRFQWPVRLARRDCCEFGDGDPLPVLRTLDRGQKLNSKIMVMK